MLLEFFLERSVVEIDDLGLTYIGWVPDLPEIRVEASSPEGCRTRLAEAIAALLASDGAEIPARNRLEQAGSLQDRVDDGPIESVPQMTVQNSSSPDSSRPLEKNPDNPRLTFTEVIYEKRDWVATVTINRPEVYNTYSSTTLREMTAAFRDAAKDDGIAVLVLTGAGDRAFCAGADVKQHCEEHLGKSREFSKWMGLLIDAHSALRRMGKPSIARINGLVAAGGNEWNLACDLAVAADHAKFMHIETAIGLVGASGGTQWLPLLVGDRRAREMLLTGDPITASKALQWGLVNEVVPYPELDSAVDLLCRKLIDRFPECTRYTRSQLCYWKDLVWTATIEQARDWLSLHFDGAEATEGLTGLAERRAIAYRTALSKGPSNLHAGDSANNGHHAEENPAQDRICLTCGFGPLPDLHNFCGVCGSKL